jgi:rhamnogalacturonan endolyase
MPNSLLSMLNGLIVFVTLAGVGGASLAHEAPPARAIEQGDAIVLDNGLVTLRISKKNFEINSIRPRFDGGEVELGNGADAGYFDFNGGPTTLPADLEARRPHAGYQRLGNWVSSIHIVRDGPDFAEVALIGGPTTFFPFHNETHWVLPRGTSGFYAFSLYTHGPGMPAARMDQTRFVIKGVKGTSVFTHHIVDDRRKGPFPTGKVIEQVQDATERFEDGGVYTKYENTAFTSEDLVHGMAGTHFGLWTIWPSHEFLNGGPLRQDLTVHEENTLLAMLQSVHFGAGAIDVAADERWSRFYGPVFFYINHGDSIDAMWNDARQRAATERASWPYAWLKHDEYPLQRGEVAGRVTLPDGAPASNAWVVLAPPESIDWALSAKGYLFWTKTDERGDFTIRSIRPGTYNLFVSGADQFVDFKLADLSVHPDQRMDVGALQWKPITHGRRLWQIGVADRSTCEFRDGENPRNYDTFKNYFRDFPDDVTFTIGRSRQRDDWYFAQWSWFNRKPFWTIRFDLDQAQSGKATLTLGIASVQPAGELIVKVNGAPIASLALEKSGAAGYRSGSQDSRYNFREIEFDAAMLRSGTNEITLGWSGAELFPQSPEELARRKRPRGVIMYDAIRLEVAPP